MQIIKRVFHLDISFLCWFRGIRVLFCVSGVLIAAEFDGVGDKWSVDTTAVDVQVQALSGGLFQHVLRSASFYDGTFFL
jgi:hypothetical protein